jgi:hypothetical protein
MAKAAIPVGSIGKSLYMPTPAQHFCEIAGACQADGRLPFRGRLKGSKLFMPWLA